MSDEAVVLLAVAVMVIGLGAIVYNGLRRAGLSREWKYYVLFALIFVASMAAGLALRATAAALWF